MGVRHELAEVIDRLDESNYANVTCFLNRA